MSSTPWTRLRHRIKGYEEKADGVGDEHGFRASENLRHLQQLRTAIEAEIDREIIRAREQGAPWSGIMYGSSKQAAQQRHAAATRRAHQ